MLQNQSKAPTSNNNPLIQISPAARLLLCLIIRYVVRVKANKWIVSNDICCNYFDTRIYFIKLMVSLHFDCSFQGLMDHTILCTNE